MIVVMGFLIMPWVPMAVIRQRIRVVGMGMLTIRAVIVRMLMLMTVRVRMCMRVLVRMRGTVRVCMLVGMLVRMLMFVIMCMGMFVLHVVSSFACKVVASCVFGITLSDGLVGNRLCVVVSRARHKKAKTGRDLFYL